MMRKGWLQLLLFCITVFCGALHGGDLLDELSRSVDELEGCFWRGFFHTSGNARRDQCMAAANTTNLLARAVQEKRKNRSLPGVGSPTDPATALLSLLRSSHHAGEAVSIPSMKHTNWAAFLREFKNDHHVKKGEKLPEIPREDYEAWLRKIGDGNALRFSRGVRTGSKMSKLQRTRLLNIEQKYREAIISLRLSIFDIRRNDPAFIRSTPTPAL